MRTIHIADETLVFSQELSFKEKMEIARALDHMGVSYIELPHPTKKQDQLLYKALSSTIKNACLSVRSELSVEAIDLAYESIQEAAQKRIVLSVPLSPVQMEYLLKKKAKEVPAFVSSLVAHCVQKGISCVFMAQDASRTEEAPLYETVSSAISAGASGVILCDSDGNALPEDFATFVRKVIQNVPSISNVPLGISCNDSMSLALGCVVRSLQEGVSDVVTAAGKYAHPSPSAMQRVFEKCGHQIGMSLKIEPTKLKTYRNRIKSILQMPQSETTPFEFGVRTDYENEVLTANSTKEQVFAGVRSLGYALSEEDKQLVYEAFSQVASKKNVTFAELDAIVASYAMQVPATYSLSSYVTNSGNTISPTAHIILQSKGKTLRGLSEGDGPIDAAFLAIEKIIGHHYELDDYKIQSVTQGRQAMGDALVRLRHKGKLFAGRGTSVDIIGASILAYINALNKISHFEVNE